MANYNKTEVVGETWRRTPQIIFKNIYGSNPIAMFDEEDIITLSSGEYMTNLLSNKLEETFSPENSNTEFQLINPITELPTGNTATYQDLYVLIHSLYFHLVKGRDRGPKPQPSWVWSEEKNSWVTPIPKPQDGQEYYWDEDAQEWKLVFINVPT